MKTLKEKLLQVLAANCSPEWQAQVFMDHINVTLPAGITNFDSAKEVIKEMVERLCPERHEDTLFVMQSIPLDTSFKIYKSGEDDITVAGFMN